MRPKLLDKGAAALTRIVMLALMGACVVGCMPNGRGALAAVDPYARPGRLIRLDDGRNLNLRCSGRGAPTVLLEAGFGASSFAWAKVQPELAQFTRVCAYDRAGYAFSDPGPLPRDGAAIVRDLDQALVRAGEPGPFVLVGHSAGGFYARLFAARRPRDVVGLVLLDPSIEHRAPPTADGLGGTRASLQKCQAVAASTPQPALADPRWTGCLGRNASKHAIAVARNPATWANQLSELDNLFGRTSDQVTRIGPAISSAPMYVFTASQTAAASPVMGFDPSASLVEGAHRQIAASSRYGFQRTVTSSHLMMVDRPEVVVAAAREMVTAQREGRLPAPLEASEKPVSPDLEPLRKLLPQIEPETEPRPEHSPFD